MSILFKISPLLFFMSCSNLQWEDSVREEFIGNYIQTLDEIILGHEKPIKLFIESNYISEFYYDEGEYVESRKGKVVKTNYDDNKTVIFFGELDESHIADYRFELFFDEKGFLHVNDIVSTGYNNENAKFYLGKFHIQK